MVSVGKMSAKSEETETPSPPPPPPPTVAATAAATISERSLGAQAVDYMRSEVGAGRIARNRLQSLASVLGVAGTVGGSIDPQGFQDGAARHRFERAIYVMFLPTGFEILVLFINVGPAI